MDSARLGSKEDKNGDTVFKFKTKTNYKTKAAKLYSVLFQFSTPKATASKATLGMAACVESASRSTPITNQRSTVV